MIPSFNKNGNLPPGIHQADWPEFAAWFGTTARRQRLLTGLKAALANLQAADCRAVYMDGSFVSAKPEPEDFDACWDVSGIILELLDPVLLVFDDSCAAQKAKYGGELFPAQVPSGTSGATFLEFFQIDKEGRAKGIVLLDLESLP